MSSLDSLIPADTSSLFLATAFVIAGAVKGMVGLGLPTVAMALLALVMAPAQAAALLIMPSLVTNVWQLRPWSRVGPMLRRLGRMQFGVVLGTLSGGWVLGAPAGAWAKLSLGVALIAYALWGLAGKPLSVSPRNEARLGFWVGGATGWVTAATGVFALPAVPYLQALGLQRDDLIQAMGISFTVSTLALAASLLFTTQGTAAAIGASAWMLLPAVGGMSAGQWLREKLPPLLFKRIFFCSLIALGAHMIIHELH